MKYGMIEADNAGVEVRVVDGVYLVIAGEIDNIFQDRDIERVRAFLLGYSAGRASQ